MRPTLLRHIPALLAVVLTVSACTDSGASTSTPNSTPNSTTTTPMVDHDENDTTHDHNAGDHTHDSDGNNIVTDPSKALTVEASALASVISNGTSISYYRLTPVQLQEKVRTALQQAGWKLSGDAENEGGWGFVAERDNARLSGGVLDCAGSHQAPDGTKLPLCPPQIAPAGSRSQLTFTQTTGE